jgi:hypothetical protein
LRSPYRGAKHSLIANQLQDSKPRLNRTLHVGPTRQGALRARSNFWQRRQLGAAAKAEKPRLRVFLSWLKI